MAIYPFKIFVFRKLIILIYFICLMDIHGVLMQYKLRRILRYN